jgi:hypothetical protein
MSGGQHSNRGATGNSFFTLEDEVVSLSICHYTNVFLLYRGRSEQLLDSRGCGLCCRGSTDTLCAFACSSTHYQNEEICRLRDIITIQLVLVCVSCNLGHCCLFTCRICWGWVP